MPSTRVEEFVTTDDLQVGDHVVLERWPSIVWKVRVVEPKYRQSWMQGGPSNYIGRAEIDYEFGDVWDYFQKSRWEPLRDLSKLNAMQVIAMAAK